MLLDEPAVQIIETAIRRCEKDDEDSAPGALLPAVEGHPPLHLDACRHPSVPARSGPRLHDGDGSWPPVDAVVREAASAQAPGFGLDNQAKSSGPVSACHVPSLKLVKAAGVPLSDTCERDESSARP